MNESSTIDGATGLRVPDASLINYTHIVYALHTLSVLVGVLGSASVVGAFLLGLPSLVGVIMNYARQSDAKGTYLESHFRWQIRTFWGAVAMLAVVTVISLPLMIVIVGFGTFVLGVIVIGVWIIYRVARGWLALRDQKQIGNYAQN
jgi:uncharacterized membrane protein